MSESAQTTRPEPALAFRPVLAVIPCLNEAAHIETVARHILAEANRIPLRLVIADGGSTDGTREFARDLASNDNRVVFLDNAMRIQSGAVNLAVERVRAGHEFLIRVDAHAGYPPRYCETLLCEQAATGARFRRGQHGRPRRDVLPTRRSGSSKLASRQWRLRAQARGRRPFVDHGHHALMRIAAFQSVCGYDESFTHNEDAELDVRLRGAGFRIWLSGMPPIAYFPRATPRALYRSISTSARAGPAPCSSTSPGPSSGSPCRSPWHQRFCSPCCRRFTRSSLRPPRHGRAFAALSNLARHTAERPMRRALRLRCHDHAFGLVGWLPRRRAEARNGAGRPGERYPQVSHG